MNFFHLLLNSIIWKGIQCTVHAPYSKPIMILGLEIYTFEDTGHGHTWAKDIYRSRFWLYDMIWSYGLLMTGCQCYQSLNKLNCFEFWATQVCPGCPHAAVHSGGCHGLINNNEMFLGLLKPCSSAPTAGDTFDNLSTMQRSYFYQSLFNFTSTYHVWAPI